MDASASTGDPHDDERTLVSTALEARLCLLDYLHRSPGGRTVQEILHHVQLHTAWGQEKLASDSQDRGLRSVQLWLKELRESSEFGGFIDATPDSGNRRRLLYHVNGGPTLSAAMPIEEALLVCLAQRHLEPVIPDELRAASLDAVFGNARQTIERHESRLAGDRPAMGHYLRSVAVHPRGQPLQPRQTAPDNFALLSSALLHRHCIVVHYGGRERQLHPCGIVVRTPKFYLVALEDARTAPSVEDTRQPKSYLFHLLTDVEQTDQVAQTQGFDLTQFITDEQLEVPLRVPVPASSVRGEQLMLHVHPSEGEHGDTLVKDLELHPLDTSQRLTAASDRSHHVLTIDRIVPTEALASWIVGRLDRVEVVSPGWLRQLIAERIATVHRRYSTG